MLLGDAKAGKFSENLTGFGRLLRRAGLAVDSARIALAHQCLNLIDIGQRRDVRGALQTVLVTREEDLHVFNELFDAYFRDPEIAKQLMAQMLPQAPATDQTNKRSARAQEALHVPRPNLKKSDNPDEEIEVDAFMTASAMARLKHADFNELNASEFKLIERLAREVALPIPTIASRRLRRAEQGDRLHWARLMRSAMSHDGDFIDLPFSRRRLIALPLLILVDVSGSMERYARLLLAFLHRASARSRRSVYAFGTTLTDLNPAFALRDTDSMLEMANERISDFGGGTRIGEAMRTFREQHRGELVGNRTITLLITDGLDTGPPDVLEREIQWLSRQSRATVWLNPLLRYDRYEPLAEGAKTLSQHVDKTLAIHNLSHLGLLAGALASLMNQVR
jgi:uncharacterized protein with von Willebrand factor type A (vWA) domain